MYQIATLNGLLARRHALLTQKNRLQWLKDGDRNSAFFHRIYSTRKSYALIKMVQIDDTFVTIDLQIGQ